ncbi:MAG: sugar-binding domain-containing protein [Acidimicrobiia bacterium]|nr:sugar-binding domain-containing protein [Acidimicrobiia bacterium]MDX2468372.1 sugar-binding domain-containing protein [Acidimicrobiia bacterium]
MNVVRTDVHPDTVGIPPGISETDYRLCVRAAMLYYQAGLTQSEIGDRLGYSRIKINRVLGLARTHGILEIKVNVPSGWHVEIETELIRLYGLRDVVVVSADQSDRSLESVLAEGAAQFLTEHLEPGIRIGLGIGRTIAHLPERFRPERHVDCTFIELIGAAYNRDWARFDVTSQMAELAGGTRDALQVPGFISDPDLGSRLAQEPSIAGTLDRARQSEIMVQSVGPVDTSAILFQYGVLTADDLTDLRERGAVGDALGYYFDIDGNHVTSRTDSNLIGINLEDVRKVPWSVLVAGGLAKLPSIIGGLRGGYFNTLVTDDATALALLDAYDGDDR